MKILFIGDSITEGSTGVSFVKLVAQRFPSYQIVNLGRNGDTMTVICQRLTDHLATQCDYDCILLQGGYNDILLPAFPAKGRLFTAAYQSQLRKGQRPLNDDGAFTTLLENTLQRLRHLYAGRLVICTMGCINEQQSAFPNRQRSMLDNVIRNIAQQWQLPLADAGALFEAALQHQPQTDYMLEGFWNTALTDRLVCSFKGGAQWLSNRRKLRLTIDGVHLNAAGAQLFAEVVLNCL